MLTAENVADVVARAAFKTKAEVDAIVASVKPRVAPADGVRRVPGTGQAAVAAATTATAAAATATPTATTATPTSAATPPTAPASSTLFRDPAPGRDELGQGSISTATMPATVPATSTPLAIPHADRPAAVDIRAVSHEQWSLRVTLDAEAKRDLETLTALLGHKIPRADVSAVLKEALRCAVEKHSLRRGAQAPARTRRPKSAPKSEACDGEGAGAGESAGCAISAAVRREVWARDGGRCTFAAPDGTRCGSRWQLEFDHVTPRALGGPSTADNLRLLCRVHNILHAEQAFGREHMERFRSGSRAASPGAASSAP